MFFQTVAAVIVAFAPAQAEQLVGRWEGSLALPDGQFMPVALRVTKGPDGAITAVADNPMFNDMDRPVTDLTVVDGLVRFQVTGIGRYEGRLSGDTLDGTFYEEDGSMPLVLTRRPAQG